MRKLLCVLLLLGMTFCVCSPSTEAASRTTTLAVILLGSLEFQRPDYYSIVTESWKKRFPESTYKLFAGDHPQHMYERFSDKQGLAPGEIPADEKLMQFALSHSFDKVAFVILTAPSVKSNDVTFQRENAQVTLGARALLLSSRDQKKTSEAQTLQTTVAYGRDNAKLAAFEKCMDILRDKL